MVTRVYKRVVNKTVADGNKAQWSERQKLEAVTTYLMVGKWPIVSDQTGIPIDTLKKWKQQDWWKDLEQEIRLSSNLEVGGKLQRIINKAASLVEDRLEHGDLHYDPRTEAFTRRPIKAQVASDIMIKSIDREVLLSKLAEKPQLKEEAIMDRLKNIEQALIRGARRKTNVIDVTPTKEDITNEEDDSGTPALPDGTPDLRSGIHGNTGSMGLDGELSPVHQERDSSGTDGGSLPGGLSG